MAAEGDRGHTFGAATLRVQVIGKFELWAESKNLGEAVEDPVSSEDVVAIDWGVEGTVEDRPEPLLEVEVRGVDDDVELGSIECHWPFGGPVEGDTGHGCERERAEGECWTGIELSPPGVRAGGIGGIVLGDESGQGEGEVIIEGDGATCPDLTSELVVLVETNVAGGLGG